MPALSQRCRQRLDDRGFPVVHHPGPGEQLFADIGFELRPQLEGVGGQSHVERILVGEPHDPRAAVRAAPVVTGGEPFQEYDVDATTRQLPGRCGSHGASANDHHVDRLHGTFLSHPTGPTGDAGRFETSTVVVRTMAGVGTRSRRDGQSMSTDTSPVGVGDKAPDFTLRSQSGELVSLSDFGPDRVVVLYFYPKDNTAGCTAEACAFRDSHEVFVDAGATVIGVSSDSVTSHEKFSGRHDLPFVLLSDPGGKVRKQYGVPNALGLLPGRVTYVIDRHGVVRHVFSSMTNISQHVGAALDVVERLQAEDAA